MSLPSSSKAARGLSWPKLVPATLLKRYKRFLADVKLKNGETITVHCPNTGSMAGCCEPGRTVYLSLHENPGRKYHYTWELIAMPTSLVGVNTLIPNRLVGQSIEQQLIPELAQFSKVKREVKIGEHSRIDLLLTGSSGQRCYIEIKNCTLVNDGVAQFPDAVTARGLRHIIELEKRVKAGHRAMMFYFIQRMDARVFRPADHIDSDYGHRLRQAVERGVEVIAYDVRISLQGIELNRNIPCEL
ncbi:MAG: DNA/RNA nuclease SfsA [Deltaproteobacteria bacterium]|jgi:sugar fermentation stimulation protein A|nr:DNA/RNA nuclease SfsA [Deltaproteobacteria bacterium]MBW2486988.1 DNA/RNA nuclease SfsA [Deltaproteobacteria bacterium]